MQNKLIILSMVVGLLSLSGIARGEEFQSRLFAGMMCQSPSGTTAFRDGGMLNDRDEVLIVRCPITRNPSFDIFSVEVHVLDQSPLPRGSSGDVTCLLVRGGATREVHFSSSSTGASGSPQRISFQGPGGVALGFANLKASEPVYLECNLPPKSDSGRSGVLTYRVDERRE